MRELRKDVKRAEGLTLTYTLLHLRCEGVWLYGIGIREEGCDGEREILLDALTADSAEAERLFALFCDNLVSVIGAEDALVEIQYS